MRKTRYGVWMETFYRPLRIVEATLTRLWKLQRMSSPKRFKPKELSMPFSNLNPPSRFPPTTAFMLAHQVTEKGTVHQQWIDYGPATSFVTAANHYTLTVEKNNTEGGQVSQSSTYPAGTMVTIEATPSSGYHFVGWEGDQVSTDPTITFVLDKDVTVKAVFLTDAEIDNLINGSGN